MLDQPEANGHIYAQVIAPQEFGMTEQQIAQGQKPGMPLWNLHECCMQLASPRGLFSPYCRTPEMTDWLADGACQTMGYK